MSVCPCCGRELVEMEHELDRLHPNAIWLFLSCRRWRGLRPHYSKAVRFMRFEEA